MANQLAPSVTFMKGKEHIGPLCFNKFIKTEIFLDSGINHTVHQDKRPMSQAIPLKASPEPYIKEIPNTAVNLLSCIILHITLEHPARLPFFNKVPFKWKV